MNRIKKFFKLQTSNFRLQRGFTLIELLVVIGIIVILMAAAIVAINPFRQFAMANNAARWSGTTTIMNAISQRIVDNKGKVNYDDPNFAVTDCPATGDDVPTTVDANGYPTTVMRPDDPGTIGVIEGYDICPAVVTSTPSYLGTLPIDPQTGTSGSPAAPCTGYNTSYEISCNTTTRRITICASATQIPPETARICISR